MMVIIGEHKTTSEDIGLGSIYWQKLTIDSQLSIYYDGAASLGYEPVEVCYDVLKKPGLEPRMATPIDQRKFTKPTKADPEPRLYANQRLTDETVGEYRERCKLAIALEPERYFQRGSVVRLDSERLDAQFDVWMTAEQIRASVRTGRWPRNPDACSAYYRMCDYWPVCSGEATIDDENLYETTLEHPELSARSDVDEKRRLRILSASSIKCYRSCARKYQFAYELCRRPRLRAGALAFGTLIHSMLERWLRDSSVVNTDEITFDTAKANAIMCCYDIRWRDSGFKIIDIEREFRIPLVNPETGGISRTFELAGKIDFIAEKDI